MERAKNPIRSPVCGSTDSRLSRLTPNGINSTVSGRNTSNGMNTIWDVIVVGGGPAGMMAAGRAAELGCSVLLLEKNPNLGRKLLITGGGRCNVTNNKQNVRTMVAQYKGSDQFLMSPFSQFNVAQTMIFFEQHGMSVKEEMEGRMFPASNKSRSVLDVLVNYMKRGGVTVKTNASVAAINPVRNYHEVFAPSENISHAGSQMGLESLRQSISNGINYDAANRLITVRLKDGKVLTARSGIVATGGKSHPETGSTGEGFTWLKKLGHTIVENNFALVPIALKDSWVRALAGVTLKDIKLTTFQFGKKQNTYSGKILFTHFGISGPTVLNMSKDVGELIHQGEVAIMLDLFPKLDQGALKQNLQNILVTESNKKLKNSLGKLIPQALVPMILRMAEVEGETVSHSVKREDRVKLVASMKAILMRVDRLLGADKAVVSSGGVALSEVDFKTMQSRIVPNLYLVGDVLNVNRPSGGYSLQLCWTTGFVAGSSAGNTNKHERDARIDTNRPRE